MIWSPLAIACRRSQPTRPRTTSPATSYVDVIGGDIYDVQFSGPAWNGLEALYKSRSSAASRSRPEWGMTSVDDPAVREAHVHVHLDRAPGDGVVRLLREQARLARGTWARSRRAASPTATCMTPLAGAVPRVGRGERARRRRGRRRAEADAATGRRATRRSTVTFSITAKLDGADPAVAARLRRRHGDRRLRRAARDREAHLRQRRACTRRR